MRKHNNGFATNATVGIFDSIMNSHNLMNCKVKSAENRLLRHLINSTLPRREWGYEQLNIIFVDNENRQIFRCQICAKNNLSLATNTSNLLQCFHIISAHCGNEKSFWEFMMKHEIKVLESIELFNSFSLALVHSTVIWGFHWKMKIPFEAIFH